MTTDANHAPWFHTTPEATLRAESILRAFHENRTAHIGDVLAEDITNPPPGGPVALLVALIAMADRLADYAATASGQAHADVIGEARRIVATAHYDTNREDNRQ